jgi:hypothetical protein
MEKKAGSGKTKGPTRLGRKMRRRPSKKGIRRLHQMAHEGGMDAHVIEISTGQRTKDLMSLKMARTIHITW